MKYFLLFLTIPYYSVSAQNRAKIEESILSSTIKIINSRTDKTIMQGTGFFMNIRVAEETVTVLVTNRHVVENMDQVVFRIKRMNSEGGPDYTKSEEISSSKLKDWIYHPELDLAIYPVANTLDSFFKKEFGVLPYIPRLTENAIPNNIVIRDNISPFQEVYMLGYPKGVGDEYNAIPVTRKGITATPYQLNYMNTKQFLIDIPIYPGSSGSPIFCFLGDRLVLLGVEYGSINQTDGPLNLAVAIKSEALLYFKQPLADLIKKH